MVLNMFHMTDVHECHSVTLHYFMDWLLLDKECINGTSYPYSFYVICMQSVHMLIVYLMLWSVQYS